MDEYEKKVPYMIEKQNTNIQIIISIIITNITCFIGIHINSLSQVHNLMYNYNKQLSKLVHK